MLFPSNDLTALAGKRDTTLDGSSRPWIAGNSLGNTRRSASLPRPNTATRQEDFKRVGTRVLDGVPAQPGLTFTSMM